MKWPPQLHQSTGSLSFICQYNSGNNSQKSNPQERQGISWTSQIRTSLSSSTTKRRDKNFMSGQRFPVVAFDTCYSNSNEIVLCNNNLFLWSSQETGYGVNWSWIKLRWFVWNKFKNCIKCYSISYCTRLRCFLQFWEAYYYKRYILMALKYSNVNINCRS